MAVAAEAGLTNVTAVTARAENLSGKYDFIIGRAVTETEQLIRMTGHLASRKSFNERKNGWILLKGGDLDTELSPFRRSAEVTDISNWFEEPWFETKKVVYLPF